MIENRNIVAVLRKSLPDIQFLHNMLSFYKLKEYQSQLLPEDLIAKGEEDPKAIPEIIHGLEKSRNKQIQKLTSLFDDYLQKAGIQFSETEYKEKRILMLFDCMAYGFAPDEVIFYHLDEKTPDEKKQYVSDLERICLQYIMSDFKELRHVFDKALTYEKLKQYYNRDAICVASKADFDTFKAFAEKHDELIIKEVSKSSGHGVSLEKTDREHLSRQFESILSRGRCCIEERVIQSERTSVFNTSSVNTVRVVTFHTKHGVVIGPCFFKTGRNGVFVDNAGSGGVFAGVNRETGVVDSDGCDEYLHVYKKHPDTGLAYMGFQLPEWSECIRTVKEMAYQVPQIGYIGWDMAYTDNGWVIIEANGAGQVVVQQITYDRGFKQEYFEYVQDRYMDYSLPWMKKNGTGRLWKR